MIAFAFTLTLTLTLSRCHGHLLAKHHLGGRGNKSVIPSPAAKIVFVSR